MTTARPTDLAGLIHSYRQIDAAVDTLDDAPSALLQAIEDALLHLALAIAEAPVSDPISFREKLAVVGRHPFMGNARAVDRVTKAIRRDLLALG
ncbi:hypothetical protein [Rhodoplanes azumiensis]|uniref:Uncharacterized protein n=1 Tax=Rhodoplanes azumiensis TaxID=1897628 RepID=A0ABW5AM54_9BRAD